MQVRHKEEIEQIRLAGHDALAMIVEQYKVDKGLMMKLWSEYLTI